MVYLVPPMDPEPPDDYVAFVADNLAAVHSEAARLVGGESHAGEVYPEALADVAGRWRRLRLLCRLGRRDATSQFLRRRLSVRAKQWRDDQIYEVDVRVLREPRYPPAPVLITTGTAGPQPLGRTGTAGSQPLSTVGPAGPPAPAESVARRLAPLLPPTVRVQQRPVAEAAIAWAHAYRRHELRRVARVVVSAVLALGGFVQVLERIPGQ
jgi:hypothetical protein